MFSLLLGLACSPRPPTPEPDPATDSDTETETGPTGALDSDAETGADGPTGSETADPGDSGLFDSGWGFLGQPACGGTTCQSSVTFPGTGPGSLQTELALMGWFGTGGDCPVALQDSGLIDSGTFGGGTGGSWSPIDSDGSFDSDLWSVDTSALADSGWWYPCLGQFADSGLAAGTSEVSRCTSPTHGELVVISEFDMFGGGRRYFDASGILIASWSTTDTPMYCNGMFEIWDGTAICDCGPLVPVPPGTPLP